jgi:hypothetical protein
VPHTVGGFAAPAGRDAASDNLGVRISAELPDSVDLRQHAPAVGDQGQIGSCVAWSIAHSVMGYLANRNAAARGAPYAPLYLYMRVVGGGAPSRGLVPDYALAEAKANGVDNEADYTQGYYDWRTAPTQAEIANAANYKISDWTRLWLGDHQGGSAQVAVEQALADGNPVLIGMPVYMDFMRLNSDALYTTLSGSSLGGHMVTIFAYDAQGVWIRNQWGTNWGFHGDAHLSWAFVNTLVQAAYTVSGLATNAPQVAAPAGLALSTKTGTTAGGTQVTITGTGLDGATAVKFGDTTAQFSSARVDGVTRLVATAPARPAGIVDVKVTNSAGTSAATAATKFTYTVAAPTIASLSPDSGSTVAATTVTVTGTGVGGATKVTSNGAALKFAKVSDTQLTVTLPTHAAGAVSIVVTNAGGASQGASFTYVAPPAPTIASLSPDSGSTVAATTVTVTGTGLGGATKVTLNGASLKFAKVSDTQLTVTLPKRAAGAVAIVVTNAGGTSEGATFTYVVRSARTATTVSAYSGPASKPTPVVVGKAIAAGRFLFV